MAQKRDQHFPYATEAEALRAEQTLEFVRTYAPDVETRYLAVAAVLHPRVIAAGIANDKMSAMEIVRYLFDMNLRDHAARLLCARLEMQTAAKAGFSPAELRALKVRGRGNSSLFGRSKGRSQTRLQDRALIWSAYELLQRLKGHNAPVGWSKWHSYLGLAEPPPGAVANASGERGKSELVEFTEKVALILDPTRTEFPKLSYYQQVKRARGLVRSGVPKPEPKVAPKKQKRVFNRGRKLIERRIPKRLRGNLADY